MSRARRHNHPWRTRSARYHRADRAAAATARSRGDRRVAALVRETLARINRGLTPQELADAAAVLSRQPRARQGDLFGHFR